MPKNPRDLDSKISINAKSKELRARFSDYESAVTLISSLQAWCEFRWGAQGKHGAGLLVKFHRFPHLGELTPDFLVEFKRPYFLLGEHLKTFRTDAGGKADVKQIFGYARWKPTNDGQTPTADTDVVVLVPPESDDIAVEQLEAARSKKGSEEPEYSPIVVLGTYLDSSSVNGEWYKLKWRKTEGNQKFSSPNIAHDRKIEDLNDLITEETYCPIRVTRPALDLSGLAPLINDSPPPLYTAIRILLPAINGLLHEEERDEFQITGKIEKEFTRDDLLNSGMLAQIREHPRLGQVLQSAIDFLVIDIKCVKKKVGSDPISYIISLERKTLKDPFTTWVERAIRSSQKRKSSARVKRSSGKTKDAPGQQRWW